MRPGWRRLILPALVVLAAESLLIGLGSWQLRRLAWKTGILASIDAAEAAGPAPLTVAPAPYAKVEAVGTLRSDLAALYGAEVRERPGGARTMGARLIVPLMREGLPPVLVDRGFVPTPWPPAAQAAEPARVTAYVRPPDRPGWFSATDDPAGRRFFTLDPAAIGTALGLPTVIPFILVALGPTAAVGTYPEPARALPRPSNDHLGYALTWFGLALVLPIVFGLWLRSAVRARRIGQPT